MTQSLVRLLRLRSLLENSSRIEIERTTALAAHIECAESREREAICASRDRVLQAICENDGPKQAQQRIVEWASVDCACARRKQLESLAQIIARRLTEGREEFFERRKERRQVESVLNVEKGRQRIAAERRTQRELDDWFAQKPRRTKDSTSEF